MISLLELLRASLASLARAPGFSLAVILTLGLGIGASAGIYSVFHHLLLKPLPVHQPESLVNLSAPGPRQGSQSCGLSGPCNSVFSHPLFRDLEREQDVFAGLAAHVEFGANIAYADRTASAEGLLVSGQYFETLQLAPALGRLIGPADDAEIGRARVAVLSHTYWQRELGGNPDVIGQPIHINGQVLDIVGITPAGFSGTTLGREVDVFVPLSLRWLLIPILSVDPENRLHHFLYLFARLQPGLNKDQARQGINQPYRSILREIEAPLQARLSETERALFGEREIVLQSGARGQSEVSLMSRMPMSIVLGATLVLLLIACVNVANLMLARIMSRSGEIAVRAALGARRAQGIARLLTESLLLAGAGGLFGLALAAGFVELLGFLLETSIVSGIKPDMHTGVVGFAALLSLACAVVCGVYPAWSASRIPPAAAMNDASGRAGGGPRSGRFRNALVTAQIGLSLALLMTAGLFAHSLWNLSRAESGVQTEAVLTFAVSPGRNGYSPEAAAALFDNLEKRLAELPTVETASAAVSPLLTGFSWWTNIRVGGDEPGSALERNVQFNSVGEEFFRTLGIPIRTGRSFTAQDRAESTRVAVVNEAFVRQLELTGDVLGRRLGHDGRRDWELDTEIVGIVGDSRARSMKDEFEPQIFIPYTQAGQPNRMHFYLRTAINPDELRPAVRAAVAELDPHLPVEGLDSLNGVIQSTLVLDRSVGTLAGLVAAMALVLVAVGLYAVLSYSIAQRTREIGLRSALGADPGRLRCMVAGQVIRMTAIGATFGLIAAWALGRAMGALLFELKGLDWATAAGSLALVTIIVLATAWLPTRRAASIQPMEALRHD